MSVQTINLGTAGAQSGDKVRDAFDKVNDNFIDFQASDLKGYYKYRMADASSFSSMTDTWATSAALLSSIPAGTYLVWIGARLTSLDGKIDGIPCSIPFLLLADGDGNGLDVQLIGSAEDTYERSMTGFGQIVKASAFDIKVKYKCLNYVDIGVHIDRVTILLLKVG